MISAWMLLPLGITAFFVGLILHFSTHGEEGWFLIIPTVVYGVPISGLAWLAYFFLT